MNMNNEDKRLKDPMSAANSVVEVYSDTGEMTDPLGMYTGRPFIGDADIGGVAIPRYDTEAVRYCSGKRYIKPEPVGKKESRSDDRCKARSNNERANCHGTPTQDADDL